MTINEFCQKIYVVTHQDAVERHSHVRKQCERLSINFDFVYTKNILAGRAGLCKNAYGCHVAHRSAIHKALQQKLSGNIMILEDDVVFCDDFNQRFDDFIKEFQSLGVSKWNAISLGYDIPYPNAYHVHESVSDRVLKLRHCWAGQSYILNPESLRTLHALYCRKILIPDWYLSLHLVKGGGIYAPNPAITKQALFPQSILKQASPISGYADEQGKSTWVNIAMPFKNRL